MAGNGGGMGRVRELGNGEDGEGMLKELCRKGEMGEGFEEIKK